MGKPRKPVNLFYPLLFIASAAFCVSACAYMVMMVRMSHGLADDERAGLIPFLARHGFELLMTELAVIAVATVGAMVTDELQSRPAATHPSPPSDAELPGESSPQHNDRN